MRLAGIIQLLVCAHCPFTFKDVEDKSWMFFFSYLMNNRIQTDLPLKMIHVSLIHVTRQIAILFSVLICLKNGKFATLVFSSPEPKAPR